MADVPPDRREGPRPSEPRPSRLMMFDGESEKAASISSKRRAPVLRILLLLLFGVATVWGVSTWLDSGSSLAGPGDRIAVPVTPRVTRPAFEARPSQVEATVATTVALEVGARDDLGQPLPDTLLRLAIESGTGTLATDTARTDSLGVARVLLALAPQPDTTVVTGQVTGADLPLVRTTVISRAGPPQTIVKLGGDGQVTDASGLVEGLAIQVLDAQGNPVPRVTVFFQPGEADALVAPSRPFTDSLGSAFTIWRLGAAAGTQRLTAGVQGAEVPEVTFVATARGAPPVGEQPASPSTDSVPTPAAELEPAPAAVPPPVTVVRRAFGVGGTFVCSLSAGRAACRGANDRGQLGGGGGAGFQGMALGVSHACALDASGTASCWGSNDGGQLGDGSRTDRAAPVQVQTELTFSIVTAGAGHTCGLASEGRAVCWGRNLSGQLGDGTRDDRTAPTRLPGDRSFQALVAGWEHTCGLSAGGALTCWGSNAQGQLGNGSPGDRLAPMRVPGSFSSVVAGSRHTCGISGERVLCWGENSFGQIGDGSTEGRSRPTEVAGLPARPARLVAGAGHTCALLEDGTAWCWGQNVFGQLGDGTNQNRTAPAAVAGDLTFTSLFAGGALTCGFTTQGAQYCWGLNQTGQLGDGTRENRSSPTRVGG